MTTHSDISMELATAKYTLAKTEIKLDQWRKAEAIFALLTTHYAFGRGIDDFESDKAEIIGAIFNILQPPKKDLSPKEN